MTLAYVMERVENGWVLEEKCACVTFLDPCGVEILNQSEPLLLTACEACLYWVILNGSVVIALSHESCGPSSPLLWLLRSRALMLMKFQKVGHYLAQMTIYKNMGQNLAAMRTLPRCPCAWPRKRSGEDTVVLSNWGEHNKHYNITTYNNNISQRPRINHQ